VAPEPTHNQLSPEEARVAEHLGRRVADIAVRLAATARP
jgi:hypothetical protein